MEYTIYLLNFCIYHQIYKILHIDLTILVNPEQLCRHKNLRQQIYLKQHDNRLRNERGIFVFFYLKVNAKTCM